MLESQTRSTTGFGADHDRVPMPGRSPAPVRVPGSGGDVSAGSAPVSERREAPAARSETVSIVIPSWTGEVGRLLASIERQTFRDYTVRVVTGVSPAARARRIGVEESS